MKNPRTRIWMLLIVAVLLTAAYQLWSVEDRPGIPDEISIYSPSYGEDISSPVSVSGIAKGNWYFEANMPIDIVDWDGRIISEGYATAQGEWMTTGMVPFEGTVSFDKPECGADQDFCRRGTIIFRNDNPSGDWRLSKAFELQVRFK